MSVPEATVNEESTVSTCAVDVRGSWKCLPVRPEPVAQVAQDCTNRQLRPGATLPYLRHQQSPLWSCSQAFHRRHYGGSLETPATVYHDILFCRMLVGGCRTYAGHKLHGRF